jgi:hypothetical protein
LNNLTKKKRRMKRQRKLVSNQGFKSKSKRQRERKGNCKRINAK